MRGLKTLVIGMAVLIVLGMVAMIVAGVRQAGELSAPKAPPAAAAPQTVDIPAGAEIVETRTGDGRIVLRLRLADGPDAVHRRQVARAELARYTAGQKIS